MTCQGELSKTKEDKNHFLLKTFPLKALPYSYLVSGSGLNFILIPLTSSPILL